MSVVRTDSWGIDSGYVNAHGEWRDISPETRAEIQHAMRVDPEAEAPTAPVLFLEQQHPTCTLARGELTLESGERVKTSDVLPAHLPIGYHRLQTDEGGAPVTVIVSPGSSYLPSALRTWGWAAQLYAVRSNRSWGIGDLEDLRQLARWSAQELNAGVLMINPLQAASPLPQQQPSPYFPTTRLYRNPLFLAIEQMEGAAEVEVEALAAAGRALNSRRLIDRDAIFRLKMQAAEAIYSRLNPDRLPGFSEYVAIEGELLHQFATFCVIAERHGCGRQNWPAELQRPSSPAVRQFAAQNEPRIRFYQWLQWCLDQQVAAASREIALMQDLPVGFDPDGADAWIWQDLLAQGVGIGAPPDLFNVEGQDWGLPPFIPHQLRASGYEPFIRTIRAALRHAGGLRIDHILGLFRLYWVPTSLGPKKGAYVRYNTDELLSIVAIESHRSAAFIVGEDLGTVEEGVREKLARNNILSYKVMWFEEDEPAKYPELALAAISTHDLPTLGGMWTGSDEETQRKIGLRLDTESLEKSRSGLRRVARLKKTDPLDQVIRQTHEVLAKAPCKVLTASLDDALGVEERPNMPATTGEVYPNWSIALPMRLEQVMEDPLVRCVGETLARRDETPA